MVPDLAVWFVRRKTHRSHGVVSFWKLVTKGALCIWRSPGPSASICLRRFVFVADGLKGNLSLLGICSLFFRVVTPFKGSLRVWSESKGTPLCSLTFWTAYLLGGPVLRQTDSLGLCPLQKLVVFRSTKLRDTHFGCESSFLDFLRPPKSPRISWGQPMPSPAIQGIGSKTRGQAPVSKSLS